jgi:hypothetical protein
MLFIANLQDETIGGQQGQGPFLPVEASSVRNAAAIPSAVQERGESLLAIL